MALDSHSETSPLNDDDDGDFRQSSESVSAGTIFVASRTEASPNFRLTINQPSQMHPDEHDSGSAMSRTKMAASTYLINHTPSFEGKLESAEPGKKRTPLASRCYTLVRQHWLWEILNAALLLVAIIATVVTLRLHDRQPVPEWPLSITINALISTYAFILKGNMALILTSCIGQLQWSWYRFPQSLRDMTLFQEAGKGPYGAVVWLCKLRLQQPIVALAAVVTILSIALDPFFQQLAQSTSCDVLTIKNRKTKLPRTNMVDSRENFDSIKSTLASGYKQIATLSDFPCSTGNCTFSDEYSTLAFCSKCEDVSNRITVEAHCVNATNVGPFPVNCTQDCKSTESFDIDVCNITTQVDPFFSATYSMSFNDTSKNSRQQLTAKSTWRADSISPQLNSSLKFSLGVDYNIIYAMKSDWNQSSDCSTLDPHSMTWACRGYGAATCSIQPCIRTYTAIIDSGQVQETPIETTPDIFWGQDRPNSDLSVLDKHCITDQQRVELASQGYDLNGQGRWIAYNMTLSSGVEDTSNSSRRSLLAKKCLYLLDGDMVNDIFTNSLSDTLEGQVNADGPGSRQLADLYNGGNIDMTSINTLFQNVEQALTVWARGNGEPDYSEPVVGQAFNTVACIQANWVWLALPAVIASMTLVVLALTIYTTHQSNLPLWKTSPLALLLHGPGGMKWVDETLVEEPPVHDETPDLRTTTGIKSMASRVWVRLEDGDDAPKLRQVGIRRKSVP